MLLARSGRAWLADPNNEEKRAQLVGQLRHWSDRAGGALGVSAQRLAGEIDRRRKVSVGGWEQELMSLRYEIVDLAPGPVRAAALEAYSAQAWTAPELVAAAPAGRVSRTRQRVVAVLATEERLLRTERLSHDERRHALEAVGGAQRACYVADGEARIER